MHPFIYDTDILDVKPHSKRWAGLKVLLRKRIKYNKANSCRIGFQCLGDIGDYASTLLHYMNAYERNPKDFMKEQIKTLIVFALIKK